MPTIQLRKVGMSYLIDQLHSGDFDAERLRDDVLSAYGVAAAVMSTPRTLAPPSASDPVPLDALIIDQRASSWDALRDWLEDWVRRQGFSYAAWTGGSLSPDDSATLHFHGS